MPFHSAILYALTNNSRHHTITPTHGHPLSHLYRIQWADARTSVEIDNYRENYLALASKRKRLQLRLRGTAAKMKFTPMPREPLTLGDPCPRIVVPLVVDPSSGDKGDSNDKMPSMTLPLPVPLSISPHSRRAGSMLRPPLAAPLSSKPTGGSKGATASSNASVTDNGNFSSSGSFEASFDDHNRNSASLYLPSPSEREKGRDGKDSGDSREEIGKNAVEALNSEDIPTASHTHTDSRQSTTPTGAREVSETTGTGTSPSSSSSVQSLFKPVNTSTPPRDGDRDRDSSEGDTDMGPRQRAGTSDSIPSPKRSAEDFTRLHTEVTPPKAPETAASRRLMAAAALRKKSEENGVVEIGVRPVPLKVPTQGSNSPRERSL
jgi:hypothetical protein